MERAPAAGAAVNPVTPAERSISSGIHADE
jgi:hypothetical protein